MSWDILPKAKLQYLLTRLKEVFDKKVDKEQGKGLFSGSYNDLTDKPSSMTPSSHTHGNIQNGGTLQTNDITIANGDKLVVTDSSDSSKIARTSISFDGSTTSKALTPKGTFENFATSNTTYTFATGDANGQIKVTPSGGSAQNVSVKGLGSAAYINADTSASNSTVVQRNGSGQIYGKHFNSNIGDEDINGYTSNPAVMFTSNDKWIRRTNKTNFLKWLGLNANVSRVQISTYLSSDYTIFASGLWSDYFYTTANVNIQGTYLVMVSAWMKDNTGGSPKFRALINGVATAEYVCSGSGLIGFTYFGIVTISTQGTLVARLQGTSNNATSCKVPAYFTHQLVLTKIDGTF